MVKKKISELPVAATVTGVEVLPVVQNGNTVRTTVSGLTSDLNVALMKRQRVIDISANTYGGVLGNDTGNDGPSIQNALNDWATNGGKLVGPTGGAVFRTTQGLVLPSSPTDHVYALDGSGWRIHGVGAFDIMADTVPATTALASARTVRKFDIEGLRIVGDGGPFTVPSAGQRGFVLHGTSGAQLGGVWVEYCETNFDLIFALNAKLTDCFAKYGEQYDYKIRSATGVIGDAFGSNSASNITSLDNCRSYAKQGALAQFYIYQSGEVRLDSITTEGGHPVDAIVFDRGGNTTTLQFNINNWHPENAPTNSHLKLLGGPCHIVLQAVDWTQGAIMIDAADFGGGDIHLIRCPRFQGKFRHTGPGGSPAGGVAWHFDYSGGIGTVVAAAALWDNGIVPEQLGGERFSGGSDALGGSYPLSFANSIGAIRTKQLYVLSTQTSPMPACYLPAATVTSTWAAAANPATVGTNTYYFYDDGTNLNLVVKDGTGTTWTVPIDYKSGAILSSSKVTANTQTGSYTTVLADAGKVVEMNVASANTLTIPPNSSVAYPIGTVIEAYQVGAGQTTLTPGSGVTLTQRESKLKLAGVGASASLRKRATNEWVVSGDLST